MAGESPAAVIVDGINGVEIAVVDAALVPLLTRALLVAGRDPMGIARFLALDSSGSITASITPPASATVSSVAQSVAAVPLLAANGLRRGALICNHIVGGLLFLKLGASASATDFSAKLLPGSVFTLPFPAYTGLITGVWSVAGGGSAMVTEMY